MKLYGSLERIVNLIFRKDGNNVTVRPNQATTYTASRDIQLPPGDAAHVLMSANSVATMTNKTFDADGTGNSISNIENADIKSGAAIDAAKIHDGSVSNTEFGYLDGVTSSIQGQFNSDKWKQPVRAASTGNVVIASELENGDTLDGVTLATGDRVLLKDQSTGSQNGIYVVVASGAASRSADADASSEFPSMYVQVQEGTANADTLWNCTNNNDFVLGTDTPAFAKQSFVVAATAGNGLAHSAGVLSVNVDDSTIEINSDSLRVKDAGITNAKVATGIDAAKLADGSVSNTEFQYIGGLTSDAQTQLNGKASTALDNLASVAINTSLVSDTNNTDDLGSASIGWKEAFVNKVSMDSNSQTTSIQGSASASASVTYSLPPADGSNGYALTTNGSGVLSWSSVTISSFEADWALADGATKVITHNLGTKDIQVEIYDKADDSTLMVDSVVRTDTNTLTLTSSEAPNASGWRVTIHAT